MWLAVASPDAPRAAAVIADEWARDLDDHARAAADAIVDLDGDTRTCPACTATFDAGPSKCPECGLFLGG